VLEIIEMRRFNATIFRPVMKVKNKIHSRLDIFAA